MPWGIPHCVGFAYNLDLNLGEEIELIETISGVHDAKPPYPWVRNLSSSSSLWLFHGEHCVEVYTTRPRSEQDGFRNCYGTLRKKNAFKSPTIAV